MFGIYYLFSIKKKNSQYGLFLSLLCCFFASQNLSANNPLIFFIKTNLGWFFWLLGGIWNPKIVPCMSCEFPLLWKNAEGLFHPSFFVLLINVSQSVSRGEYVLSHITLKIFPKAFFVFFFICDIFFLCFHSYFIYLRQ